MSHIKGFVLPTLSPHAHPSGTWTVNILKELRRVSGVGPAEVRAYVVCMYWPKMGFRSTFTPSDMQYSNVTNEFRTDTNRILCHSVGWRYWWQLQICIYDNYKPTNGAVADFPFPALPERCSCSCSCTGVFFTRLLFICLRWCWGSVTFCRLINNNNK